MMQMFKGELQRIDESLSVSLPPEWLAMNGLNKGDSVKLRINEAGSLIVEPVDKQIHKNKLFKELVQQDHDLMMRLKNR